MAEKKIYDVEVQTGNSAKNLGTVADGIDKTTQSLKDLKTALKEAKDAKDEQAVALNKFGASSEQFLTASRKAGQLKNKINEVGSTLGAVTNKLKNLDFSDAADSAANLAGQASTLLSLGKALRTNPLFLIAATVTAIGLAFKGWIDSSAAAAKAVIENSKEAFAALDARNDREIALAKARGEDTYDLEQKKIMDLKTANVIAIQLLEERQKKAIEAAKLFGVKTKGLNDEELKELKELHKEKLKLQTEYDINLQTLLTKTKADAEKKKKEDDAKAEANRKEANAKALALQKQQKDDTAKAIKDIQDLKNQAIANDEARELAILKTANDRRIQDVNKSKANSSVKAEELKLIESKYQSDVTEIAKKYEDLRTETLRQKAEKQIALTNAEYKTQQDNTNAFYEEERSKLLQQLASKTITKAQFDAQSKQLQLDEYNRQILDAQDYGVKSIEAQNALAQLQIDNAEAAEAAEIQLEQDKKAAKLSIINDTVAGITELGALFAASSKQQEQIQRASALAGLAIDTASAIGSLTKNSEANPANAVTFGAAGTAQFVSGLVRILANVGKAAKLLKGSAPAPSAGNPSGNPGAVNLGTLARSANTVVALPQTIQKSNTSGDKTLKVVVVESDITDAQNRISNVKVQSTF